MSLRECHAEPMGTQLQQRGLTLRPVEPSRFPRASCNDGNLALEISVKPCICNGTKHIRGPDQCVISSQPVSDGRHGSSLKGRLTCQCLGNRVSLRAGEAGDSKSLRDPPQAPCFSQAGAFLFRFGPKRVPFLEISPKSWGEDG